MSNTEQKQNEALPQNVDFRFRYPLNRVHGSLITKPELCALSVKLIVPRARWSVESLGKSKQERYEFKVLSGQPAER